MLCVQREWLDLSQELRVLRSGVTTYEDLSIVCHQIMDATASLLLFTAAAVLDREETRARAASTSRAELDRLSVEELKAQSDFTSFFRLTRNEFDAIFHALQLNDPIVSARRDSERAEVALLLVCAYLGGARLATIRRVFRRSESSASGIIKTKIAAIHTKWGHLLAFNGAEESMLAPDRLKWYATRLAEKGCPLNGAWGFVDGTLFPVARPSRNQRAFYTGWKRLHALKFQALCAPDGMIWFHGPCSGRRNDNFILRDSQLIPWLREHSFGPVRGDNTRPSLYVYGDKAYFSHGHLIGAHKGLFLTPRQRHFNRRMASLRIAAEWSIGGIKTLFPRLEIKRSQRTLLADVETEMRVCTLLRNAVSCVSGNENSMYFRCETPVLSDYFS